MLYAWSPSSRRRRRTLKLLAHFGAAPHALPSLRTVPSNCTLTSGLSSMLRGLRTLRLRPHYGPISNAPAGASPLRVLRPNSARSLRSFPACSEGAKKLNLPLFKLSPREGQPENRKGVEDEKSSPSKKKFVSVTRGAVRRENAHAMVRYAHAWARSVPFCV